MQMEGGKENTIGLLRQNGISALSFSKNQLYCAIALKKNVTVLIFEVKTFNDINSWEFLQQFKEHTQTVSDIDWSDDQKILTASHDRSVFVWKKTDQQNMKKWKKMLVNINIKLSVLACKWGPSCKKFVLSALPSSLIFGFYQPIQDFWAASALQNIVQNPIVSLDFHPSGQIVAIGTLDGSVRIISCNFNKFSKKDIKDLKIDDFPYNGPFQNVDSFGQIIYSIEKVLPNMKIWINHVSFQNKGSNLLILTHSNHVKWYDVVQKPQILCNQIDIYTKSLPYMNGLFNQDKKQLVLGGFDRKVSVYTQLGNNWKFERFLSSNEESNLAKKKGLVKSMRSDIEKKDSFGVHPALDQHLNTVKVLKVRGSYVSYDLNGVVHFWK